MERTLQICLFSLSDVGFALFLILSSLSTTVLGQEKKDLTISFSSGILNSPHYPDAHAREFYGIDFAYQLGERHVLSANYLTGGHHYFDDKLSNVQGINIKSDGSNAQAEYRTSSVIYRYQIIKRAAFSVVPGIGAGVMAHTRVFPYQEPGIVYTRTSSWADLVFPVTLDLNVKISRKWQAGLTSGFLIHPDNSLLALHAGPKLSYTIK